MGSLRLPIDVQMIEPKQPQMQLVAVTHRLARRSATTRITR